MSKQDDNSSLDENSADISEPFHTVESHPSYKQVMLDVDRCAGSWEKIRKVHYHVFANSKEYNQSKDDSFDVDSDDSEKNHTNPTVPQKLKDNLVKLIIKILCQYPDLHYYQGFHDVCLTYMVICNDKDKAFDKLVQLIDTHFKIFMQPTMKETQEYLDMIPIVIGLTDKNVENFLDLSEAGTIFALSWIITWFSHVIPYQDDVETLYAFFETHDPHIIIYFSALIVLHFKDKLLKCDCEMSSVHQYLCQLPKINKLPLKELMRDSKDAIKTWPPEILKERLSLKKMNKSWLQRNLIDTFSSSINKKSILTAALVIGLAYSLSWVHINWRHAG